MSEEEKTIENLRKNKGVSFAEADIILNLIEEQQKEIDKQNKVIDEIYNAFYEFIDRCPGSGMRLLKDNGFDVDKCDKCVIEDDNINCKKCIKQYFIRKVEEDGENNNRKQTNSND